MTDSVGRHAARPSDHTETLILPAQGNAGRASGDAAAVSGVGARDEWHPVGRHASGRSGAAKIDQALAGGARAAAANAAAASGAAADAGTGSAGAAGAGSSGAGSGGAGAGGAGAAGAGGGSGAAGYGPAGDVRSLGPRTSGRDSAIRLVWVYPDLLSTYGDRGNLLVLSRRAALRGIGVEAVEVNSDQPVPTQGDIYLLGGGEDLPQVLAARRLAADGGLSAAAAGGAVVFAVCAGYQLVGDTFGGVDGQPIEGLGILDISSGRGERRGVGELVADIDPSLSVPRLTGFENHQGITRVGSGARPLATVSLGVGNGDGTEGAYAGKVLGTYMHGPALARNPGLADLLLSWVAGRLQPLDPMAEEWAGQLRAERLSAVGARQ